MRGLIVTIAVIAAGCWYVGLDRPYETAQTWPESYAATTCADWTTAMTPDQRTAAAADLLGDVLSENGSVDEPGYRQVVDWTDTISSGCQVDADRTVQDVSDGFANALGS